jgi:hypothetical protein
LSFAANIRGTKTSIKTKSFGTPEIVTETTCLAIIFRWNEISSEIFHFRYSEIQKENLNLGTNIRLPEIKYFACPKILN